MAKATGKRKTTSRISSSGRKRRRTRSDVIRDNVILVGIGLLCVLLFLALVGIGGIFGAFASRIEFGLFGVCAYAFPLLLLVVTIWIYVKRRKKGRYMVPVLLIILYLLLCLLLQLLTGAYATGDSVLAAFSYSMSSHLGGGIIGGAPEVLLRGMFGLIGAYLIDICGLILCFVALTGRSFVAAVGKKSNQAYHTSKDAASRQKERWDTRRIERAREKEQRRMDRVVSGVSNDMTVTETAAHQEEAADPLTSSADTADAPAHTGTGDTQDTSLIEGEVLMPFSGSGARIPYEEVFEEDLTDEDPTQPWDADPAQPQDEDPAAAEDQIPEEETAWPVDGVFEPQVQETPDEATEQILQDPAQSPVQEPSSAASCAGGDIGSVPAEKAQTPQKKPYRYPPLSLLEKDPKGAASQDRGAQQNMKKLQETLLSFGVDVTVTGYEQGPTVTRYELLPAAGVKVSKILSLTDDIKLALAAADVRIEAPIPGKSAIGIEVPNSTRVTVHLRDLLETKAFQTHKSRIVFAAGKDISGNVILADIQKMPHLLIAGATGSGKSVCINTIVMSILYHASPDEVRLIMVDPKVVELSVYNGIPHLLSPVVTDPKKAAGSLNWAVQEMTRRYQLFSEEHVRDISSYNEKAAKSNAQGDLLMEVLPQIVIIVDELADLMMVAPNEVEDSICRLAQLARAAGLHLVIATQRPSVNVITGLIKANMPSRIAFSVSSGVDSRTILDMNGAEKLLGNGDMLYYPQGLSKPKRVQGAFVTDEEVSAVVSYLKSNNEEVVYQEAVSSQEVSPHGHPGSASREEAAEERDELYVQAGRFLIESEKGSIGSLQRRFRVGFNRAARIVDQLTEDGVLGKEEGTKAREILMTPEAFEAMITEKGLKTDAAD